MMQAGSGYACLVRDPASGGEDVMRFLVVDRDIIIPSRLRAPAAALLILPTLAGSALAGAWTQPEGRGQAIVTGAYTQSPRAFGEDGETIFIPDYDKFELNTLVEYGLTDDVTAIFQPLLQSVTIDEPTDADRFGLGFTEIGARARLWSDERSVFSGQVIARIPGAGDEDNPAALGNTDPEFDTRALYGRSFTLGTWSSFFDAQLGYRIRFDDPANEIRADLTLGTRPHPDVLLLAQSFNTMADGSAEGIFENGREHKAQLSAVWDVTESWSLQLGGIATVAGENALRERGVVAAVWRRF